MPSDHFNLTASFEHTWSDIRCRFFFFFFFFLDTAVYGNNDTNLSRDKERNQISHRWQMWDAVALCAKTNIPGSIIYYLER